MTDADRMLPMIVIKVSHGPAKEILVRVKPNGYAYIQIVGSDHVDLYPDEREALMKALKEIP